MFAEINSAFLIALLFLLVSGCYLYLIIDTIVKNTKSSSRDAYLSAGMCLLWSSLSYALMTVAVNEIMIKIFWAMGFISGCLFFSRWLLFSSYMVDSKNKNIRRMITVASVVTVFICILCILSDDVIFVFTKYGVQYSYYNSLLFKIMLIYISLLIIMFLVFDFRWWRESVMKRDRMQGLLFIVLSVFIAPLGIAADYFFPVFTKNTGISLEAICFLPVSLPFFISMRRYKTLSITVPNASGYVFNTATIPTLVLDYKNNIRLENPAALDFLDRSVIGLNISEIILSDEKTPEQSFFDNGFTSEKVTVDTPLGVRICDMLLAIENDRYNDALCKVAILRDITEEEHKDYMLQAALEQAQTANEAKSDFLASMSHEIRTPMNAILGMSELLLSENMTKRQLEYATDIQSSSLALLDIINDILDLSKIQSGKLYLVPVHYDFSYLIDNVCSIAQLLIDKKKENLSFRLHMKSDAQMCLFGDNIRLRQVLLNLLSNAAKFTEKGYVSLSVGFTDDTVSLTVSDTGIGIPAESMDTLFDAFVQADLVKNRNIKGTGLGLTITKSIVDMMGGEVTVESEYGKGTSFTVIIPRILGDENLIQRIDNDGDIISAPDAKVLVVDDNQTNLNVACGLLRICQISADTAMSGQQAIEKLMSNQFDVVFMDHMMPEMDGIATTKTLRDLGVTTPIVALTASAIVGMREMMLEAGMNDYLSKPIIRSELIRVLKTWIPAAKIIESSNDQDAMSESFDDNHKEFWEYVEHIEELYFTMGLDRVYGQRDVYEKSLRLTIQEIEKTVKNLRDFLSLNDMESFRIEIHGIKGVLANIGAMDLSSRAFELEKASEIADIAYCNLNLHDFLDSLSNLSESLVEAFLLIREGDDAIEVPPELVAILNNLIVAFEKADLVRIESELDSINAFDLTGALSDEVEQMKDAIMMMDYDSATEHIKRLL